MSTELLRCNKCSKVKECNSLNWAKVDFIKNQFECLVCYKEKHTCIECHKVEVKFGKCKECFKRSELDKLKQCLI